MWKSAAFMAYIKTPMDDMAAASAALARVNNSQLSRKTIVLSGTIHYLSDGLETRAPPYYVAHISVFAIIVTG